MLAIEALQKDFGGQRVLDGASLTLKPGQRAALVGANGAGKSTILRIVAGVAEPDRGNVSIAGRQSLGYLPQDVSVSGGRTVREEVRQGQANALRAEAQLRHLERELNSASPGDPRLEALVHEHARLHDVFEHGGGYALDADVGRALAGLGFSEADADRPVSDFSGGWQMRVALARVLLARPSVLLLDEPTNHLDLAATEWLESTMRKSPASLLVVSHDRYLLDAVVDHVFELRAGRIETFVGNYSAYVAERSRRDEALTVQVGREQEEMDRLAEYVRRYKAGNRATMAKSREKALGRLQAARTEGPPRLRRATLRLPASPPSGREVVTLRHLSHGYGENLVLDDVSLTIERGARVALLGANGTGKSTLLRLIAGVERPRRGSVALGVGVQLAYAAQDHSEHLTAGRSVLDEVYVQAPASWDIPAVRSFLGGLAFSGDEQLKLVDNLSGGERARVALARLLLRPSNLLVLDEPTNHLDAATREQLESALTAYDGTLIFATHDRYLVDRLATIVLDVGNTRGAVKQYVGNYAAYRRAREAESASAAATLEKVQTRAAVSGPARETPRATRNARDQRRMAAEMRDLERQVTEAEVRLKEVELLLSDPSAYDGDLHVLSTEHGRLEEQVRQLTESWEHVAEAAETSG